MENLKIVRDIGKSLKYMIFPRKCPSCEANLHIDLSFCLSCFHDLPQTLFEKDFENLNTNFNFIENGLIKQAYAPYWFRKGSKLQILIHHLKYKNMPMIGEDLGRFIGTKILNTTFTNEIEIIVPIPLHTNRQLKRGYNQSYHIAKGISKITKLPISNNILFRGKETVTQTKLKKSQREDNLKDAFLTKQNSFSGILLVDDLITTGCTIESAAKSIIDINPNVHIKVVAIALADIGISILTDG